MKELSAKQIRVQQHHPRTLIIHNAPEESLDIVFQEFIENKRLGSDVEMIQTPADQADLKKQLKESKGTFDRVVVCSHGRSDKETALMRLTKKDDDISIANVIKTINENISTPPQEIHLYACEIGGHFEEIGNNNTSSAYYQDLLSATKKGQNVILHGDDKKSGKTNSISSIAFLLESKLGLTSCMLPPNTASVGFLHRNDDLSGRGDFESFYHPAYFMQRDGKEKSFENYREYMNHEIARGEQFEKANGIVNRDDVFIKVSEIKPDQVQDLFASMLSLDLMQHDNKKDAKGIMRRWKETINNDKVNLNFITFNQSPLLQAAEHGHFEMIDLLMTKGANPNIANTLGFTPLHYACNDDQSVKSLLKDPRTDLNAQEKDGWTALMKAAHNAYKDVVQALLADERIEVDLQDKDGYTALSRAARKGGSEIIDLLMTKGANPNIADIWGFTPLHHACDGGHLEPVKSLLKGPRTDLNAQEKDGWTALMKAAHYGYKDVVQVLLADERIEVDLQDKNGDTALSQTVRKGDSEIINLLMTKGANPNIANTQGFTPLHHACNDDQSVKSLLKDPRTDLNAQEKDGWTALMKAAHNGYKDVVQALLADERIEVDLQDKNGDTALSKAVRKGDLEIINLLMTKGANPNIANTRGFTPLHHACDSGHLEVVKSLLKGPRTDLNAQEKDGWAALMKAAYNGYKDVVQALLADERIEVNLQSKDGYTALSRAARKGDSEIIDLLMTKGANPNIASTRGLTPLHHACDGGHLEVVKSLLKDPRTDLNAQDKSGWTALMGAVHYGYKDVVQALLADERIEVDLQDKNGDTALSQTVRKGDSEIINLLMTKGANPNIANTQGFTPLHHACDSGHLEVVKSLLKDPRTDLNAQDKSGWTALMGAVHYGYKDVVQALLADERIDLTQRNNAGKMAIQLSDKLENTQISDLIATVISKRESSLKLPPLSQEDEDALHDLQKSFQIREKVSDNQVPKYTYNNNVPQYLGRPARQIDSLEQDTTELTGYECVAAATLLIAAGLAVNHLLFPSAKTSMKYSDKLKEETQKDKAR